VQSRSAAVDRIAGDAAREAAAEEKIQKKRAVRAAGD
jgi:hypothetical protein